MPGDKNTDDQLGKEDPGTAGAEETEMVRPPFGAEEVEVVTTENSSAVEDVPLPAVQKAGYRLAIFLLLIISGFLVFLLAILATKSFDVSAQIDLLKANVPDSIFQQQKDLIEEMQEEKKNYRDFIQNMSEMVLLNLLLPTLTAILGYIFGSREGRTATNSGSSN